MPGPDPNGVTLGDDWPERVSVLVETFESGNRKARMARAKRILGNLHRGGWLCYCCGGPVPLWRRSDARFCREGCRKRTARARRIRRSLVFAT
jgi:hypothetical protein